MALNTVVRTNLTAVNAHRKLSGAGIQQTSAAQRLSSGKRINSAADDVAGLGISEKMRSQVVSMDRASLNAQDGMSLIQTADGALSSINEMLIRIRELVVKGANDTNVHDLSALSQSDRRAIQDEIDQLMLEINNVAYRTEFNTRVLLDGSLHQNGTVEGSHQWIELTQLVNPAKITTLDQFLRFPASQPFTGSFEDILVRIGANLESMSPADWIAIHGSTLAGLEAALDIAMGVDPLMAGNSALVSTTGNGAMWESLEDRTGLTFRSAEDLLDSLVQGWHNPNAIRGGFAWNAPQVPFADWQDFINDPSTVGTTASTFARLESTIGGMTIYHALRTAVPSFAGLSPASSFNDVRNVFYRLNDSPAGGFGPGVDEIYNGLEQWLSVFYGDRFGDLSILGNRQNAWNQFALDFLTGQTTSIDHRIWVANEEERRRGMELWLQTGANSGQGISVGIQAMNTRTLGQPYGDLADMINVENPSGRWISDQINILDEALTHVNRQRANLGAVYNRLEFTRMGLGVSSENLTAAISRIRDADMAKETMNMYQANIMTQAATAMIAHANQAPQAVMELLQ